MAVISTLRAARYGAQQRWQAVPGNIRGAAWIMLAAVWFTGMAVAIKITGQTMTPWQIVLLRSLMALVIISPMLARQGFDKVRTQRPRLHFLRVVLGFCGITTLVFAITHLELALVTTLGFTRTLFVIVLALVFLDETLNVRRATATVAGFLGVVICMEPGGGDGFDPWVLVALASAFFAASVSTTIKHLTRTEAPITILVWSYTLMALLAAGPAWWFWRLPTAEELAVIAVMSVLTTLGQSCMVLGLRAGDASAVVPFDYTRLLYAAAIGFLFFAEVPTLATFLGALVIVASTLYIALRTGKASPAAKS